MRHGNEMLTIRKCSDWTSLLAVRNQRRRGILYCPDIQNYETTNRSGFNTHRELKRTIPKAIIPFKTRHRRIVARPKNKQYFRQVGCRIGLQERKMIFKES